MWHGTSTRFVNGEERFGKSPPNSTRTGRRKNPKT
jgi:hypothetical protein